VRAFLTKFAGFAAYLVFVSGLGSLCVQLSSHLSVHALTLASPYLVSPNLAANGERRLTLVERRRVEATVVAVADPEADADFVPDAPSIRLGLLAAQMDLSEKADLIKPRTAVLRGTRSRAQAARPTRLAAADAFGRSFGVMLMASR
jgi:hypothetical protein